MFTSAAMNTFALSEERFLSHEVGHAERDVRDVVGRVEGDLEGGVRAQGDFLLDILRPKGA